MLHTARKIDERNINDRNIDERKIDYQMLDSMDTAALREFLRADIEAPAAEQADIELVMYAAAGRSGGGAGAAGVCRHGYG